MDVVTTLAAPFLTRIVSGLYDRYQRSTSELHARASEWSVQPEYDEMWLGFTVSFVCMQSSPLTLTKFEAHIGFLDPTDAYATAQRHKLQPRSNWAYDEAIVTAKPRERIDQPLWMRLGAEDLAAITAQRRSIGVTLTAFDAYDKRYWKRLLLTISGLDRAWPETLGPGEWCHHSFWPNED